MTFTLSGSTITQSGTDAALPTTSGNGMTVQNSGGVTVVDCGSNKLRVEGDLTISPETHLIQSNTAQCIVVANGGHLTIDGEITVNGNITHSTAYFLHSSYKRNSANGTYDSDYACLYAESGSTVTWNGGYIKAAQPIVFEASSAIRITSGGWNALGFFSTYAAMVRAFTDNLNVNGFKFLNGGSWVDMVSLSAGLSLTGFEFNHAYGMGGSGGQADGVWLAIENYEAKHSIRDGVLWSKVWRLFQNAGVGSALLISGGSSSSSSNNVGIAEIHKEMKASVTSDGAAIPNAVVYIRDTDDGNRANAGSDFGGGDYETDRTYTETTDALGATSVINVLLASVLRTTSGAGGTSDTGLNTKSYRGKNGTNDDVFDMSLYAYGYAPKQVEVTLKGTGVLTSEQSLILDASITQESKSLVDAYTEITTAKEFYDRAAAWLADNYTGQTEGLVARSGNKIDAGSYDVVIDRTAASPFAVSSTTITIKADTFSGDLQTTGTVTRANGATVSGSVKDANGVLFAVTDLPNRATVGAWLASQGEANRTGIITSNNATLQLANNTEYFVIADAIGRVRSAPVRVNTANVSTLAIDLVLITNALGTNLIPSQLTAEQQTIADMFVYNQTDNRVDITLPSGYASNDRWDSASNVWTFTAEDFFAVAWKVEDIQSATSFLNVPRTVTIGSYALLLDAGSPLVLRQAQANLAGAIINMARFQVARLSDDNQRNTFIDDSNGPVRVNAGNPVVATLSTPQSTLEAVVSQIPSQVDQSSLVRATAMNTQVTS